MTKRNNISLDQLKTSACAKLNPHLFEPAAPKEKKRSKFNNVKTEVDGEAFDSKKEAKRYKELRMLLKTGKIGMLARQVQFELNVGGTHSLIYIADFTYLDGTGNMVVEDVKSPATRALQTYRKKRMLMKKLHDIDIVEV